ncbi:MAG: 30S ribosomal protein S7 [Candidatus Tagabacteria bacterium RIFCSPLOWO2_01_FULL_39_11]|uniref:Small ribosomal subunit protein uS7 n=1 Tax=Candidatus Tagabacteria bacterium RIFCSPLOWO2_01_FULL_39_11 TaxID=1802295 RepID=A0A1G2LVM7_9BACT|nr:MAG: 30S ribosomal protein S7 [Candidatus Tagabacteria bacterium RIFCSPLOWO2_01_FULL_39_11]
MRKKIKTKKEISPDNQYNSVLVAKFTNHLMKDGKKSVSRKVLHSSFDYLKEKLKTEDPVAVFEQAIKNVSPSVEIRSRRVGGANYQVPREVRPERRITLAMRWIITASRAKKGMPMSKRLAEELIAASKNEGAAVRKREITHKMAEANKAFAHFAW